MANTAWLLDGAGAPVRAGRLLLPPLWLACFRPGEPLEDTSSRALERLRAVVDGLATVRVIGRSLDPVVGALVTDIASAEGGRIRLDDEELRSMGDPAEHDRWRAEALACVDAIAAGRLSGAALLRSSGARALFEPARIRVPEWRWDEHDIEACLAGFDARRPRGEPIPVAVPTRAVLAVSVVDASGAPVVGSVACVDERADREGREEGWYSLDASGGCRLEVPASRPLVLRYSGSRTGHALSPLPVEPLRRGEQRPLIVRVGSGVQLHGTLRIGGEPARLAEIRYHGEGQQQTMATQQRRAIQRDGTFAFADPVPPGRYSLTVTALVAGEERSWRIDVDAIIGAAGPLALDVE